MQHIFKLKTHYEMFFRSAAFRVNIFPNHLVEIPAGFISNVPRGHFQEVNINVIFTRLTILVLACEHANIC